MSFEHDPDALSVAVAIVNYGTAESAIAALPALQTDLDAWLVHYNTARPHLAYRNQGRRPVETVMSFVSQED